VTSLPSAADFVSISLQLGSIIDFYHPRQNEVGIKPVLRRRRILIRGVRDLVVEPLRLGEIVRQPVTRWGRYIIEGLDLASNAETTVCFDWHAPREFEILHSDGKTTGIISGPSRMERLCFAEVCAQLDPLAGFTTRIAGNLQIYPTMKVDEAEFADEDIITLAPLAIKEKPAKKRHKGNRKSGAA